MADFSFNDLDAGLVETVTNLLAEGLTDLVRVGTETDLSFSGSFVWVLACSIAQGSLTLNPEISDVVLNLEHGLSSVINAPDNNALNFNRGAISVIDLDAAGLKVANTERHGRLGVEWVDPPEAGIAHCANILAAELADVCVVGRDDHHT